MSLPTFHPKAKIILRGDPDFKVNAYQYATSSNNGMYPSTVIYPFELEDIFKTVDHAKPHNKNLLILLLQMQEILPLGSNYGSN